MSRVSLIEQLYAPKKKSALEFNYDGLWAPPIRALLTQQDINELYKIATSLKYNDNIEKKYELIDAIMRPRGFKRGNCGTNRVVYNFLEDTSFCMKIALDRVGIKDSPKEYKNQEFFKPFCCKIFEVDPTGVIACVERVNPISSLEEFMSIADDVFNMMIIKIIGKYVVDDLGTEKFMNYGIRYNSNGVAFGPVILDYPYAYELDGAKLHCSKPIQIGDKEFACGGEIDYDAGLNNLVCTKCGRTYSARELAKDDSNVLKFYTDEEQGKMRARIVRTTDGTIIKDSGRSSKIYLTKEEYEEGIRMFELKNLDPRPVEKTIKNKYVPMRKLREQYYTDLQVKAYEEMQKRNTEPFNPVIRSQFEPRPAVRAELTTVVEEETSVVANDIFEAKVLDTLHNLEEAGVIHKDENDGYHITDDETPVVNDEVAEETEIVEEDDVEEETEVVEEEVETETVEEETSETESVEEQTEAPDMIEQMITAIGNLMPELDISKEELEEILERNNYNFDDIMKELKEMNAKTLEGEEEESDDTEVTEETVSTPSEELTDEEIKERYDNIDPNDGTLQGDMKKHIEALKFTYELNSIEEDETSDEEDDVEEDETETSEFDKEMESEVFPEINNSEIIVGVNLSEEPDYSNYIPPEEDETSDEEDDGGDDEYSHLYPTDRKEEKRDAKQIKSQKSNIGDMSDY